MRHDYEKGDFGKFFKNADEMKLNWKRVYEIHFCPVTHDTIFLNYSMEWNL